VPPGQRVVAAALGPRRWSDPVLANLATHVSRLREHGRLVPVPVDRRLAITGITTAQLPKALRSAGHALLQLLQSTPLPESDRDRPGETGGLAELGLSPQANR
jgi:hypothetical protein